jgi:dihydroorotate dehydrogenase (NAD+) catalytic subunit
MTLSTQVCGLDLRNPTILASGILGSTGSSLRRVAENGAGAVVTKSIGIEPREGHKNPTVVELRQGVLNAIGLANPGYRAFKEEMEIATKGKVPVIASVFGFTVEEFVEVARAMESYGAAAVELNLSCPHVEKAGSYFGQEPEMSYEVTKAVKEAVGIPIIAKLTAHVKDIVEIAKACEEAKCDGLTAINTLKGMKIDVRVGRPVLGNKVGGLSGPYIKPVAVRCVYEIAKEVDVSILGCGGIINGEDAVEFLMAGARAVEIGTGVYFRGISIFQQVSEEIEKFMRKNGYESVEEMVGAAL